MDGISAVGEGCQAPEYMKVGVGESVQDGVMSRALRGLESDDASAANRYGVEMWRRLRVSEVSSVPGCGESLRGRPRGVPEKGAVAGKVEATRELLQGPSGC